MCYVDRRDAEPTLQVANFLTHLDPQLGVEVRKRLVEQKHARADHDCARERDALLLAPGQLAGELLFVAFEADQREHVAHVAADRVAGLAAHAQSIGHVLEHGQVREQRVVLEHEADIAPVRGQVGDIFRTEQDATTVRLLEAGDHAQRGGLAASRRSEQGQEFARAHVKFHIASGKDRSLHTMREAFGYAINVDAEGLRCHRFIHREDSSWALRLAHETVAIRGQSPQ